jgi:hypothetical protein
MSDAGRNTRASAEEYSIIGVILLLFGVTWVAYAYQQPTVRYQGPGVCGIGPGIPSCTSLSSAATAFYALGIVAMVIGSVFLLLRVMMAIEGRTHRKRPDLGDGPEISRPIPRSQNS